MTIRFKEFVFVFAVVSVILCAQYVASDEIKRVADNIYSPEATLTFQRNCVNDNGCLFKNDKVRDEVQLTCNEAKCQCRNPSFSVPNVRRNYYVRELNGQCRVSDSAPCGTIDGITLECVGGLFCIEGRCRSEIRQRAKYTLCDEDIDCQIGLQCVEKKVPPIVSYCREPIAPTLTFERECKNFYDCSYGYSYFACKQGKCQCEEQTEAVIMDRRNYPVHVSNDKCVVSHFGNCGTTNGITVVCGEGDSCIEGLCRSRIRTFAKNSICEGDIDCQEGLKCVVEIDSFPIYQLCKEANE